MEQNVLIIGYKSYNFTNDKGEVQSGVKVSYLTTESYRENERGFLPIQQSMPYDFFNKLKGPGLYKAKFSMVSGSGNKPKIDISDFEFVKSVDFSKMIEC